MTNNKRIIDCDEKMVPKVYIVCGCPGAGKSFYGKKLAERLRAAFLDIDISTERLVRLALEIAGHDPADTEIVSM